MQLKRRGVDKIPAVLQQHGAHFKALCRRLPVQPVYGLEQPEAGIGRERLPNGRDIVDVALLRVEAAERDRPVQVEADEVFTEDLHVRAPYFMEKACDLRRAHPGSPFGFLAARLARTFGAVRAKLSASSAQSSSAPTEPSSAMLTQCSLFMW